MLADTGVGRTVSQLRVHGPPGMLWPNSQCQLDAVHRRTTLRVVERYSCLSGSGRSDPMQGAFFTHSQGCEQRFNGVDFTRVGVWGSSQRTSAWCPALGWKRREMSDTNG